MISLGDIVSYFLLYEKDYTLLYLHSQVWSNQDLKIYHLKHLFSCDENVYKFRYYGMGM